MTLHLTRIGVNLRALAAYAVARRLRDDDHGYALHSALLARFGDAAPRPFRFLPEHAAGAQLLGYVTDATALTDAAALPVTEPQLAEVFIALPALQPMPATWRAGARYGFEVRVRPVVRYGKTIRTARSERSGAWQRNAGEVDAHVAARERVERAGGDIDIVDREAVYCDWLSTRLAGAATIEQASMKLFRRTRTIRSTHRPAGAGHRIRSVEGPDAVMGGTLTITDPAAFAEMLARGLGRHAGFGFGMLLLSPPGRAG